MFLSKFKNIFFTLALLMPIFLNSAQKKEVPKKIKKQEPSVNIEKKIEQLEKEIEKKKKELFKLEDALQQAQDELGKLKQKKKPVQEQKGEVFYDLGSGLGKLPIQAILHDPNNPDDAVNIIEDYYKDIRAEIPDAEREMVTRGKGSPVYGEIIPSSFKAVLIDDDLKVGDLNKAVGVELSPTRHHHAVTVKTRLESEGKLPEGKTLEFRNENMLESDVSDATLVYLGSTCYPDELMDKLVEMLSNLKDGLRVVTLKELPDFEKYGFKKIKEVKLPMTWSSASSEHFYVLDKSKKKDKAKSKVEAKKPIVIQEDDEDFDND